MSFYSTRLPRSLEATPHAFCLTPSRSSLQLLSPHFYLRLPEMFIPFLLPMVAPPPVMHVLKNAATLWPAQGLAQSSCDTFPGKAPPLSWAWPGCLPSAAPAGLRVPCAAVSPHLRFHVTVSNSQNNSTGCYYDSMERINKWGFGGMNRPHNGWQSWGKPGHLQLHLLPPDRALCACEQRAGGGSGDRGCWPEQATADCV